MSYARPSLDGFTVDWITAVLVAMTAAFQGIAIVAVRQLQMLQAVTPTQTADLSIGAGFIAIAAVEIGVLLLLWRGFKRLPERWQERVKAVLLYGTLTVVYYTGLYFYWQLDMVWVWIFGTPLIYATIRVVSNGDFKWLAFNLLAFTLGVFMVTAASMQVAPAVVLLLMAAFTIYDHVAVNLSNIMGDLVELSTSVGFPNFIVIPSQIRFDLSQLKAYVNGNRDKKPANMAFMIGVGDFAFPAMLTVSLVVAGSAVPAGGALLGTLGATVVLRDALETAEEGLPALPWLNTGAIVGFLVGAVVSAQPVTAVLGL